MSLATYTITQNGSSEGNVIQQPFTIEVCQMTYVSDDGREYTAVNSCTKNGAGNICINDDVPDRLEYALQGMGSSKSNDLTNTFETSLTTAYGTNWSKN